MSDYEVQSHAEFLSQPGRSRNAAGLAEALDALSHAAFGQYDGVIAGTPEFKRWFMSRPGMTDESRFLAAAGDRVVSSVFVTLTPMQWAGQVMAAGLVDSVMTHPNHRRKGLARALLTRALDFMEGRGTDLSLLYTVAGSMAYEFYASMGYVDYVRVQFLRKATDDLAGMEKPAASSPMPGTPQLRALLDAAYAGHDGYLPMSQALWQWRRETRPSFVPVNVHVIATADHGQATFAVGQAPIRRAGRRETMTMLNDCAASGRDLHADLFEQMLARVPVGPPAIMLCAETNEVEREVCLKAGFEVVSEEACMIKPISDRAERALRSPPRLWYAVTESVVGI